jgi:hypothetical protein
MNAKAGTMNLMFNDPYFHQPAGIRAMPEKTEISGHACLNGNGNNFNADKKRKSPASMEKDAKKR